MTISKNERSYSCYIVRLLYRWRRILHFCFRRLKSTSTSNDIHTLILWHDVTPPSIDSLLSLRELLDVSQQLERLLAVGLTHGELFARALHLHQPRPLVGQLATQLYTRTKTQNTRDTTHTACNCKQTPHNNHIWQPRRLRVNLCSERGVSSFGGEVTLVHYTTSAVPTPYIITFNAR